jgi:outer membrane lipoprotein-sorting protein
MKSSVACALSLLLAAASPPAHAESPTLEQLMRGLASSHGVITEFRETKQIALLAQPLESRGRMYFAPPDRLARFTFEPSESALIIDGDRLLFRDADAEELDLSNNPMARAFVDNFIVLFNGDLERLEHRYRSELSTDGESWSLRLKPRSAPLSVFVIDVSLSGDADGIREMTIRNVDGDETVTRLESSAQRVFSADELQRLFDERQPLEAAEAQ